MKRLQDGGHFYCIDFKALGFDIYGSEMSGVDFAALDVMLIPCASQVTLFDGSVIGGDENCIWDKRKMEIIMDMSYNLSIFHN